MWRCSFSAAWSCAARASLGDLSRAPGGGAGAGVAKGPGPGQDRRAAPDEPGGDGGEQGGLKEGDRE